ncbi:hypothetical protein AA15237_1360 [Komagataeibacter xylinus NBRC 15237]|nr:hypothetical protein AA15237_1360 [Komagataeibacter xylinus NBRC 15237]
MHAHTGTIGLQAGEQVRLDHGLQPQRMRLLSRSKDRGMDMGI